MPPMRDIQNEAVLRLATPKQSDIHNLIGTKRRKKDRFMDILTKSRCEIASGWKGWK